MGSEMVQSNPGAGLGVQIEPVPQHDAGKTMFPEVTQLRYCTANVCVNGHEWIPKMALARCGYGTPTGWNGCGAPVLAIKMENCPQCNQPVRKLRFRTDYTPPAPCPVPICIPGSVSNAEVQEIVLERTGYLKTQQTWDEKFEKEKEVDNVSVSG